VTTLAEPGESIERNTSMNIVILGCGRVGSTLASMLSQQGHDVTVIDQDGDAFRRLDEATFQGQTVVGDGTDVDVLRRAGLDSADAFVAVTNGDNRNIMAAQIAKHIFQTTSVVCRIYDQKREEIYRKLGLVSVSPTTLGAQMIMDQLFAPERPTTAAPAQRPANAPRATPAAPEAPGPRNNPANRPITGATPGAPRPR